MHVWSDFFFTLVIPLLPLIKADSDLDLTYTEVGLFRSVLMGATAVLQVPLGFLAERTGEFWLLVGGNIWVATGLVGLALVPAFFALVLVGFLVGLGGGAQHPLGTSMVSRAYDEGGRSTAVGTVNFSGDLGKMAAPAIGGLLGHRYGWRSTFKIVGSAGLVFMLASMFTRRSVSAIGRSVAGPSARPDGVESTQVAGFAALSAIGALDSMARAGALVFLPFVLEDKGMGLGGISVMLFLLFAGGAIGKFVCGWLGERIGAISLIWWTKGLTAALMAVVWFVPLATMAPLMVVMGIGLNGTSSVLYATVSDLVPAHRRARLYGLFYTTNEAGTMLSPLIYGRIADVFKLRATMLSMGLLTALILPVSLSFRRYARRQPGRSGGQPPSAS